MVLRLPLQIKKLTDGGSNTLKPSPTTTPPASLLTPSLLTESAVKSKLDDTQRKEPSKTEAATIPPFDQETWFRVLCEYMMTQQTPFVRRQVRKLLLFICGTKTKVSAPTKAYEANLNRNHVGLI
jgi:hypothetical protein